jgi:hypothetical protein
MPLYLSDPPKPPPFVSGDAAVSLTHLAALARFRPDRDSFFQIEQNQSSLHSVGECPLVASRRNAAVSLGPVIVVLLSAGRAQCCAAQCT